jgi:hypothetical protein
MTMAYRFNPPANWPAAPAGWVPPAGWQPDPAWGPVPEGWNLWIDDAAVPAGSPVPHPIPVAPRKKRTGLGILILAVVLVIVVAGVVGLSVMLNTLSAGPPVEGVERAGSIEEARAVLQETHDEATDFVEDNHGFSKTDKLERIAAALEAGNKGTSIWEVEMQTRDIMVTMEAMAQGADRWNETWGQAPAFTDNVSGTALEAILDEYTGGTVDFAIDSECGSATACVQRDDPNVVHLNEEYVDNPRYVIDYADVLLHEYGHVTQFKYIDEFEMSADYEALFDFNVELHADCMSLSLKPDFATAYGSVCSPEQLTSAKNAWGGVFN